ISVRTCPVLAWCQFRFSSSVTSKLDDEVARKVLRLDLAALLSPKAKESAFIVAHDDPGVRAADEVTASIRWHGIHRAPPSVALAEEEKHDEQSVPGKPAQQ